MTRNRHPLVSFVVRTHNRAGLLKRALECLVNQTYRPIEIFVVDHNSSDNTRQVATSFGDIAIYYLHKGSFRDTFNNWTDRIAGEFVSVLDDDDYIKPDCIEKLADVLLDNDSIGVAFCRHRLFRVAEDRCTIEEETGRVDCDGIRKLLPEWNHVPWNAVLFKRSCLRKIPKIDESITGTFDCFSVLSHLRSEDRPHLSRKVVWITSFQELPSKKRKDACAF